MTLVEKLLLVIAIAMWCIWYELRYGIEKRAAERKDMQRLSREWSARSRASWDKFRRDREGEKNE